MVHILILARPFPLHGKPQHNLSDNGPEFGMEFKQMVEDKGATHTASTSRNPQGNSIIERTHQAIGQVLRTVVAAKNPTTIHEANDVIAETLATAMHAHRCSCQSSNNYLSPGALAFSRDMFLDTPLVADIMAMQRHRQLLIDKRLLRANSKRVRHDYMVDDVVYKRNYLGLSDKLTPTGSGPYRITRVHTNGTVTLQLSPTVQERINIRRIYPQFPLRQPR